MINLIAACGHNRIIGKQGKLPWSIKEDWEYFLATTRGGILIMGRHCYEEFEQFAPEREVIALTETPSRNSLMLKNQTHWGRRLKFAGQRRRRLGFAEEERFMIDRAKIRSLYGHCPTDVSRLQPQGVEPRDHFPQMRLTRAADFDGEPLRPHYLYNMQKQARFDSHPS